MFINLFFYYLIVMTLDSKVWGPHYWFVLQSMALTYSLHPNSVTKKKYYDFIQNIPLFLPDPELGNEFSKLLDKYPVTPYLDSRESFMKWSYFIYNRILIIRYQNQLLQVVNNQVPHSTQNRQSHQNRTPWLYLMLSNWY